VMDFLQSLINSGEYLKVRMIIRKVENDGFVVTLEPDSYDRLAGDLDSTGYVRMQVTGWQGTHFAWNGSVIVKGNKR